MFWYWTDQITTGIQQYRSPTKAPLCGSRRVCFRIQSELLRQIKTGPAQFYPRPKFLLSSLPSYSKKMAKNNVSRIHGVSWKIRSAGRDIHTRQGAIVCSTKPWVRVIGCPDTFGVLQAWSKESPILVGWEEPHGQRQVASYGRMHWTKVWI